MTRASIRKSNVPKMIETPGRLIAAQIINSENLVYRIDAGSARAVFDGDVMLEPECYTIDPAHNELTLKRPPAFEVKILAGAAHD